MKLQDFLNKIRQLKLNKFTITAAVFLVWVSFFDRHNFFNQYKLSSIIHDLKYEKEDLLAKIEKAKKDKIDLDENVEKYAREKYHMLKDKEEVYIIKK
ncbi:MAG TPA: septum formation initiator family protein [Saprospiraceae bacterium]|nr:septum formation initiator family protein [Saprospiraceae bacterium]